MAILTCQTTHMSLQRKKSEVALAIIYCKLFILKFYTMKRQFFALFAKWGARLGIGRFYSEIGLQVTF